MNVKTRLGNLNWDKWLNNTLVFVAPIVILYLGFAVVNVKLDGFQTEDLVPGQEVIGGGVLYLLNVLLDFFKKYRKAESNG